MAWSATLCSMVWPKMTCVEGDAFEAMKELKNAEERFDVVITDPPAFIKRKKDLKNGEAAYRRSQQKPPCGC